jgi:hypothetical protein
MFDLIHASLAIRKAAVLQGVRTGEVKFSHRAGGRITYVYTRRGYISITEREAEEAAKYTWQEINSM